MQVISPVIFVDSNIPMYLVGNPHSNRDRALVTLDRLTGNREILVTDTDVCKEILHRYSSIGRRELIDRAFSRLNELV
jgi:predicted nucleic acid-binding protein